jgi:hypothetical protein
MDRSNDDGVAPFFLVNSGLYLTYYGELPTRRVRIIEGRRMLMVL